MDRSSSYLIDELKTNFERGIIHRNTYFRSVLQHGNVFKAIKVTIELFKLNESGYLTDLEKEHKRMACKLIGQRVAAENNESATTVFNFLTEDDPEQKAVMISSGAIDKSRNEKAYLYLGDVIDEVANEAVKNSSSMPDEVKVKENVCRQVLVNLDFAMS